MFGRIQEIGSLVLLVCFGGSVLAQDRQVMAEAQRGSVAAQKELAIHYTQAGNYRKAAEWLQAAANQGEGEAAYQLGILHFLFLLPPTRGIFRTPYHDPEYSMGMALGWMSKAASADYSAASCWMGWYASEGYRSGRADIEKEETTVITPPSEGDNAFWSAIYRNRGQTSATSRSSVTILPPPNYQNAAAWYLRGANLGNTNCMFSLAGLYERGLGVPQNLDAAIRWYSEAASNGHSESALRLQLLTGSLSRQ